MNASRMKTHQCGGNAEPRRWFLVSPPSPMYAPRRMIDRRTPARMSMRLRALIALLACLLPGLLNAPALGQEQPVRIGSPNSDRPISEIIFLGLKRVSTQEVQNNIRAAVGDPYDPRTVQEDVFRLNRLGQFKYLDAVETLREDGTVAITYRFTEQQIITERQVVGNRLISDADLLAVVQVVPLGPRDDFMIQSAKGKIEDLYRKRGYYLTVVEIDESELNNSGLLIFHVIEGPRVKVKSVVFEGNKAYTAEQLDAEVKTRTALLLFRKGELDDELLTDDVASLTRFYTDRGYLDVRVDRKVDLSPENTEAKVTFIIAEGQQYRMRTISVRTPGGGKPRVFAREQIIAIIELKSGDVYSGDLLRMSIEALKQAYGLMGYLTPLEPERIRATPLRVPEALAVDLELIIDEGPRTIVGEVQIVGNNLTRDNVVRRDLRGIKPGLPIDGTQIIESENRLVKSRLFSDARITVQPPNTPDPSDPQAEATDPNDPDAAAQTRNVLVEVKERGTGSVNFGVALGSDSGLFGEFSIDQKNFDITDTPESLSELISGKAFRGAGQQFNFTVRPGTELFQVIGSWLEPRMFDSDYSLGASAQILQRYYDDYDQNSIGTSMAVGRRFGDIWNGSIRAGVEQVTLDNIEFGAPTAYFEDAGPSILTSVGLNLTRTTIGSMKRPGSGSRLELVVNQFGIFGGDYTFSKVSADYTVYFTLHEDFLGRRSTLRLNSKVGYIFGGDAPIYEKFYLGGRSFRGFEFRTISPKGIRSDNGEPSDQPVGGDWQLFLGAQYEFPLFSDAFTGVIFLDTGTVTDSVGFDEYRVSIGAGIRLYIPQFGDVPIALDFGIPLLSEEGDQEQIFSFSAELPF